MNAKDALRITDPNGTFSKDDAIYQIAEGFLEGYAQASKAAEPLLEVIEKQRKALEFCSQPAGAFSRDHHQHAKNCLEESMKIAQEALSSSAQVVENYRKEVLGE